jgi:hypothetical protein
VTVDPIAFEKGCAHGMQLDVYDVLALIDAETAARAAAAADAATANVSAADALFGRCRCPDDSGSCDWCYVYYNGPDDDNDYASEDYAAAQAGRDDFPAGWETER